MPVAGMGIGAHGTNRQKDRGSVEIWHGDFTASLEALGGQTVTVGSVNAQLQAVVSFQ